MELFRFCLQTSGPSPSPPRFDSGSIIWSKWSESCTMGWAGLKKKKKKRCSRINWSSYCIECSLLGQYPDHGHLYPVDPGEDLQLAPTHTETPQMKESNIIIQPLVESDNTSVNACKGHLTLRIYCSYRTTVCALTMRNLRERRWWHIDSGFTQPFMLHRGVRRGRNWGIPPMYSVSPLISDTFAFWLALRSNRLRPASGECVCASPDRTHIRKKPAVSVAAKATPHFLGIHADWGSRLTGRM